MATKTKNSAKMFNYTPGKNLNVRLRGKLLSTGNISLFLDIYHGYRKDEAEKMKTFRKTEYLKMYLKHNPRTTDDRLKNDEVLTLAQTIRSNRESDLLHNREGLLSPGKKKINFLDFCEAFENSYPKKDKRMVTLAIKNFKAYVETSYLLPKQIDQVLVKGFRDYLLKKYKGEGPNSTFARFKKILNAATEKGLFTRSPGEKVTCKVPDGIQKEILSEVEIVALAKTKCSNPVVKRAFLLSFYTGLRYVDVKDLKFKDISNGMIRRPQLKTGREVCIQLHDVAVKLIGASGKSEDLVFDLPTFEGCLKILKKWAKDADINRNITWHSARHSFATMLLMKDTDIKTVGNLLGHSKLEHTQKYTHVVDKLKDKAISKLPDIEI